MLADLIIDSSKQSRTSEIQQIIEAKLMHFDLPSHLREAAINIARIQNREKPFLTQPMIYTFFGDHGIAESGLCKRQGLPRMDLVKPYLAGHSALNVFSRQNRIELRLIDCGLSCDLNDPKLIQRKIGHGNQNFAEGSALTKMQLERCVKSGRDLIRTRRNQMSNAVGIGIQAIGSEVACLMLLARLRGLPIEKLVDHPAFRQADLARITERLQVIADSYGPKQSPLMEVLNFAGFEMATALGAILQACHQKCMVLLDGLVGSCIGWIATLLFPDSAAHMIIAQNTRSFADTYLTNELRMEALTHFDTSVSDGSGIALSLPMIQAACSFLNESSVHSLQSGA